MSAPRPRRRKKGIDRIIEAGKKVKRPERLDPIVERATKKPIRRAKLHTLSGKPDTAVITMAQGRYRSDLKLAGSKALSAAGLNPRDISDKFTRKRVHQTLREVADLEVIRQYGSGRPAQTAERLVDKKMDFIVEWIAQLKGRRAANTFSKVFEQQLDAIGSAHDRLKKKNQ
jgi:hypothetical protein